MAVGKRPSDGRTFRRMAAMKLVMEAGQMRYTFVNNLDKVELQVEHPLEEKELENLRGHCHEAGQCPIAVEYHRRWTFCVWVVRPTVRCLRLLREMLKQATNGYKVYLVELARDFLIPDANARAALEKTLVRSLTIQRRALQVKYEKGTFYWGLRGPISIALYVDRRRKGSDWTNPPCVHIELRLRGTAQLRRFGLQTLAQLLAPDFDSAWSRTVTFVHVPRKKAALGRLLGMSDVSGTALRKRADAFMKRGAVLDAQEVFAVQNVKIERRSKSDVKRFHLPRGLTRIDFNVWCRNATRIAPLI